MARRDLSRTVIEGGRRNYNKFERRASHGAARAHQRAWLDEVLDDEDVADERVTPRRKKVHRAFYDKLAVTRRWMRAQCGRPWDDVFSELMERFDPRTVAGRHIVFDHMLRDVRGGGSAQAWACDFEVDADGILRVQADGFVRLNRNAHKRAKLPPWTDGFRAVKHGGRWWWIGDRIVGPCAQLTKCRYAHAYGPDASARHFTRGTLIRLMTSTDVGRLGSSPPRVRDLVLWRGDVIDPADATLALAPTGSSLR